MRALMLGLLAETPIHAGSGRGVGVIDLPVMREAATDYPVIPGSSLKGALLDKAERYRDETTRSVDADTVSRAFGKQDRAGDLMISDARMLLLPIRSLTSSFFWVTCPHVVERYCRDLRRAGLVGRQRFAVPTVSDECVLAEGGRSLFLEERQFQVSGKPDQALVDGIRPLIRHEETRNRLGTRIAIVSDNNFAWFARYGLPVQARNVLKKGTKESQNLWYEETLPPDTVMHSLVASRSDNGIAIVQELFPDDDPYLQAGGNETVGHGWFAVTLPSRSSGEEDEQ